MPPQFPGPAPANTLGQSASCSFPSSCPILFPRTTAAAVVFSRPLSSPLEPGRTTVRLQSPSPQSLAALSVALLHPRGSRDCNNPLGIGVASGPRLRDVAQLRALPRTLS